MTDRDYVLGTHDEELERLGLQHQVWRPHALGCWQRAGITRGSRVLDVGAGPGYCTVDLAEIVGATGSVLAIERSRRFLDAAEAACRARHITNVELIQQDLLDFSPVMSFDFAWCRWVACFVSDPQRLVAKIADCVRTGGAVVFHEYSDYRSWRLAPRCEPVERFAAEVMASWRATGGEPDIALSLPTMLDVAGFRIRSVRPLVFVTNPKDFIWQWPAAFLEINLGRLVELGRVTAAWADEVRSAFEEASNNPATLMTTPIVMEIIAERI